MTARCHAAKKGFDLFGSLLLTLAAFDVQAETAKRVLVVHSYGRDAAPFSVVASSFRSTLTEVLGGPVDFYEVSLDFALVGDASSDELFVAFLARHLALRPVDLVVTNGATAVWFVANHRQRLFPATPVVIAGGDSRVVPPELLDRDVIHVTHAVKLPGLVEDILLLKPETTNIAVVFGSSVLERFWASECRREFAAFEDRVSFTWLTERPLDQVLEQCAGLPADSFVLFVFLLADPGGLPHDQDDVLSRLHAVANAPIHGYFASRLGGGTIGGRLYQDRETGMALARVAARVLRGEDPGRIQPPTLEATAPTYDWRELHRWGIKESRLPPGSIVLFRQPTSWQRNWRWIVALVSVCLLETVLVVFLLVNSSKRRAAEAAVRDFRRRLIRTQEDDRARLARELHDDVTQRLARLAIDVGMVEGGVLKTSVAVAMRPVREELVRLSEDVHALSYRLHPSVLEDLGLAEALRAEAERFSRQESVAVEATLGESPAVVPQDRALCLFRVAQAALRNVARHASARKVEMSMRSLDGGLELVIRDDGVGFTREQSHGQTSLGLTSMRERVHLLGGTFDVESAPGRGTVVTAWVPLEEEPR
jgi:signal transduction histidine kinase